MSVSSERNCTHAAVELFTSQSLRLHMSSRPRLWRSSIWPKSTHTCCYPGCSTIHVLQLRCLGVHKHQASHAAGFCMQSADLVSQWASDISDAVRVASSRPSSLLVFINPFGGNGQAAKIWQSVSPVFQLTGASLHILHYLWDMLASLDAPCFCFLAYLQARLWIVS